MTVLGIAALILVPCATHYSIQVILENKDERNSSRGTNLVNIVICIERASRYIEKECIRRLGIGGSRIQVGKRVFVRVKKGIWGRE